MNKVYKRSICCFSRFLEDQKTCFECGQDGTPIGGNYCKECAEKTYCRKVHIVADRIRNEINPEYSLTLDRKLGVE